MKHTRIYVGGEWVRPISTDVVEVANPATAQIIGEVPASGVVDVDHAVLAARDALPGWSVLSPGSGRLPRSDLAEPDPPPRRHRTHDHAGTWHTDPSFRIDPGRTAFNRPAQTAMGEDGSSAAPAVVAARAAVISLA